MAEGQDKKSYLLLGIVFLVIIAMAVAVTLVEQQIQARNRQAIQPRNEASSTAPAAGTLSAPSAALPAPTGTVHPIEVTQATFSAQVLKANTPVMVDFWAPWCGPCRQFSPIIEQIAEEQKGQIKVVKVNIDDNPQLATQYGVDSIPTLIFFKQGKEVDRTVGALPREEVLARLAKLK
ncbi:MAG: thioredoxin [Armatimonadota bacterium]